MASTWARVGKLLSVASLIWLGLTGLPTALGLLMAGGGWPERAYMEGMVAGACAAWLLPHGFPLYPAETRDGRAHSLA